MKSDWFDPINVICVWHYKDIYDDIYPEKTNDPPDLWAVTIAAT